mmetsp:Transcript_7204/g.44778  ORF Transcript_7204/g.44778 Transcript_7204/m.44778 type:complete len:127 (+) Transcript_7204:3616-3996(+)
MGMSCLNTNEKESLDNKEPTSSRGRKVAIASARKKRADHPPSAWRKTSSSIAKREAEFDPSIGGSERTTRSVHGGKTNGSAIDPRDSWWCDSGKLLYAEEGNAGWSPASGILPYGYIFSARLVWDA